MNRRSTVSLGPGASSLILIFVVLALSVLGMLSLLTARNDLKFSERSAQVIEAVYRWLANHSMLDPAKGDAVIIGGSKPEHLMGNLKALQAGHDMVLEEKHEHS